MPHLVATLIYLSQNYSYYIRGDRSALSAFISPPVMRMSTSKLHGDVWFIGQRKQNHFREYLMIHMHICITYAVTTTVIFLKYIDQND